MTINFVIKIAGIIMVLTGSCGLGIRLARNWREHLELLEQLRKMIFLLKGQILYANAPLEEAFERVGNKSGGSLGDLFVRVAERIEKQQGEGFFDLWKEEVHNMEPALPLSKRDRKELTAFGEHLGYLDRDMQERTMLLYLEQLDLDIDYLREHLRERSRLYTSLGVVGGLFLVIIMC